MDDLVAFLDARYKEDEQTALALQRHRPQPPTPVVEPPAEYAESGYAWRFDPARMLAEVEAKRRIVDEHKHYPANAPGSASDVADFGCGICAMHPDDGGTCGDGWCKTLRLLALPYVGDHHYRQEWKP